MISSCGGMADALDSGSSGSDTVWVQVPSTAFSKFKGLRDLERTNELVENCYVEQISNKIVIQIAYF